MLKKDHNIWLEIQKLQAQTLLYVLNYDFQPENTILLAIA